MLGKEEKSALDYLRSAFGSVVDTWTQAQQAAAYRSLLNQMIKAQGSSSINTSTILIVGGIGLAAILLISKNK
jgi:hypothetical protein